MPPAPPPRPRRRSPSRAVPAAREPRPGTLFADITQVAIGATVFDRDFDMPGTVRNIRNVRVELERPTGFVWSVHFGRLRPATERERRQLAAIGRLHRTQQRGLEQRGTGSTAPLRRPPHAPGAPCL